MNRRGGDGWNPAQNIIIWIDENLWPTIILVVCECDPIFGMMKVWTTGSFQLLLRLGVDLFLKPNANLRISTATHMSSEYNSALLCRESIVVSKAAWKCCANIRVGSRIRLMHRGGWYVDDWWWSSSSKDWYLCVYVVTNSYDFWLCRLRGNDA